MCRSPCYSLANGENLGPTTPPAPCSPSERRGRGGGEGLLSLGRLGPTLAALRRRNDAREALLDGPGMLGLLVASCDPRCLACGSLI